METTSASECSKMVRRFEHCRVPKSQQEHRDSTPFFAPSYPSERQRSRLRGPDPDRTRAPHTLNSLRASSSGLSPFDGGEHPQLNRFCHSRCAVYLC